MTTLFIIKFGSNRMKCGGVAFGNFAPIGFHINDNEKKFKSKNFGKKKKKRLEIWGIVPFHKFGMDLSSGF